jgi:hypothetical protein
MFNLRWDMVVDAAALWSDHLAAVFFQSLDWCFAAFEGDSNSHLISVVFLLPLLSY